MPARKKRDFKWYLQVASLVGLFLGGGFLTAWLGERGARGVRIMVLEKQVEELKEDLDKAESEKIPSRESSPRGEGPSFRARMLSQAQYLEQQMEAIELPGFVRMTLEEKQSTVRCLVYHLAVLELAEECDRRDAPLSDQLYCQDPMTKELIEIPQEVKRLAEFCGAQ